MNRFEEIATFVRVVEEGSFSAAARTLARSPSAISKLVARLEDRLRVRLFNRTSRSLGLTPEGEALHKGALGAMAAMEDAESSVAAFGAVPGGTLRVHATPMFAKYQIAPLVPSFLARYPGIRLEFLLSAELMDPVEAAIDVIVRPGPIAGSSLIVRRIGSSHSVICAAPAYLARHGQPLAPDDLKDHNCLNFPMRTPWNEWPVVAEDELRSLHASGSVAANQGEFLLQLTRAGIGIMRFAEYVVEADLRSGVLVPILADFHDASEEPIYCAYQNRRNLSPRIRVFFDFLKAAFAGKRSRQTLLDGRKVAGGRH